MILISIHRIPSGAASQRYSGDQAQVERQVRQWLHNAADRTPGSRKFDKNSDKVSEVAKCGSEGRVRLSDRG